MLVEKLFCSEYKNYITGLNILARDTAEPYCSVFWILRLLRMVILCACLYSIKEALDVLWDKLLFFSELRLSYMFI